MSFLRKKSKPEGGLWLVAGLGNPGPEYASTRHNAGFMVARRFIERHGMPRPRGRYGGRWTESAALGRQVAVLMPQTYMNSSGEADRIIIIHDDLDFPFGVVRCRQGGGTGGHNGLTSIVKRLGASAFYRVRVGIGRPEDPGADSREWVLSSFPEDQARVDEVINSATDCTESILTEGIEAAMSRFNQRRSESG
jgi:PTH1 family peptidyl-tRNA hydrolase